jgi:tRNA 2-thiouridine synthesizing protein A
VSAPVLDCRGRRCPLPIIELARLIGTIEVGTSIVLEADDPAAGPDVRAWCRMRGHELVASGAAPDGTPSFEVRRRH